MGKKNGMKDYPIWMKKKAIELYPQEGWSSAESIAYFGIRDPIGFVIGCHNIAKKGNTEFYIARLEMENNTMRTQATLSLPDFESVGCAFESFREHHILPRYLGIFSATT